MPRTVSLGEFIMTLETARGARPVTFTATTDARLRSNPFGQVNKRSRVNGMVNWNYQNSVNRQRAREDSTPDFEASPRKWGRRIPKSPFVIHKGQLYMEVKVERSLNHQYVATDGQPLSDTDVAPFLPKRNSNKRHQGVEREVILRDYRVDHLDAITIDGEQLVINPATVAPTINRIANLIDIPNLESTMQWKSLNDVFAAGTLKVWYMKSEHFGVCGRKPDPNDMEATHVKLGEIAPCPGGSYSVDELDQVWVLQGEFWSPWGEANTLIKGLRHTSMSVGDCFQLADGRVYMVADVGFKLVE